MELYNGMDCSLCGAKESVEYKKNLTEAFDNKKDPAITLSFLDGYFCKECNEGFWSEWSERRINKAIKKALEQQHKGLK